MDPALKELMKGSGEDEVEAIVQLDPEGDVPPHVRVIARFGEIATVRLPRQRIAETWADESVVSLKAARPFGLDPDPLPMASDTEAEDLEEETDDRRRPEGLGAAGRGVVVAVLDWGFDFAHPNFRNRDGSTRALALWDQSAPGPGPDPYGYGRVYTREEIDRALRHDEPYRALGYHPASGDPTGKGAHGTHVLDIAAGNGRAEGAPLGIAPEADLLFVHLANLDSIGKQTSLGSSVTLCEGLDWVFRRAGDRPCVVNMSVGRHGGPHNGLTLVERGLDALLAAGPGRAVVQSTGNYYAARVHASGYLRPGQQHVLRWCTDRADLTPNELEVWYPGRDVFTLEIRSPEGETRARVPLGGQAAIEVGGREVGRAYHRAKDPASGDNHVDVFLDPQAPAGCWQVVLSGEDVSDGRFHAWVERDAGCPTCQSRLDPGDADPSTTLGTIANGFRSITVGAYDAHSPDRTLGAFSSCGPTRDGRLKPDLLAPGVRVLAARSASLALGSDTPLLTRYSGTSMAAPHVTGTVALMFEAAARPLTIQETRKLLLSTAQEARLESEPSMRLGSGYLDIERAVEAAKSFTAPPHAESASEISEIVEEAAAEVTPEQETEAEEAFETEPEDAMENETPVHACGCSAARETFEIEEPPRECRCHALAKEDEEAEPAYQEDLPPEGVEMSQPVDLDAGSPLTPGCLHPAEVAEVFYREDQAEAVPLRIEVSEGYALQGDAPALEACGCRHERAGTSPPLPAEDWIELAHEAVRAGGSLLDPVLGRVESAGSWWEASLSPATLFDSIVAGGALRQHFVPSFEILALPGETPLEPMEPGDLLVRRSLGEGGLGHVAMVASGETWEAGDLAGAGLRGEAPRPGQFVHVVEGGYQPHRLEDGFARRALDETGRLPFDQILLRPRVARPAYGEASFLSAEVAGHSCKPGEGPPAAVPDPDGKGLHPLVLQGVTKKLSRNPTVGDAQELLNRFLDATKASFTVCPNSSKAAVDFMTKKRAVLTKNGQDPLSVDCRFGENTGIATKMFQTCMGIDPDGKIGPITWANLELLRSRGSLPTFRPCCILAPAIPLGGTNSNFVDPTSLGVHGTSSEARGLIYSGKGGFLDLGHIRDHCDETKFVFDQIVALGGSLGTVQTANGFAMLKKSPSTTAETIRVARAICIDDGLGHEIFSYDLSIPGMHNSSFSPEDLCSNFLGTLLAELAINAGGVFNTAVTTELDKLVKSLDGQTVAETRKAFDLINGRWVDFSGTSSVLSDDYLKRRNFEQKPFQTGHASDATPPSFVTAPIPDQSAFYDFFYFETRKLIPKTSYAVEIARIRKDAAARYGKDFDKP
ncbi:MAG: hypothetical protein QOF89_4853 [Acidobacteriota bacterium]|jgi:subtilisin family serine protease|nr:hypothetical protein [Acidobacteriota bacterium]